MNSISTPGQGQGLDKKTMLSSKMTFSDSKPSAESIRERLMKLFTLSEDTRSAEREIERRVSELAHEFLSSPRVSTEVDLKSLLDGFNSSRMPGGASDVEEYIDALAKQVVTHSINTASPRYIGHMTSALPYFVRPLGELMTAINQNLVKMETARSFSPFERQVMAMMHRLVFALPDGFYDAHTQRNDSTLGMMTTGGTEANTAALWCARNSALGPKADFAGISKEGVAAALRAYGYKRAVILGSSLIHYSFEKAGDVLGIGSHNVIRVPVDRQGRINLLELRKAVKDCRDRKLLVIALIGVAGATDSGAVDPLDEMAEVAREFRIHFHVDAAWGGALLFSDQHRHILAGIEKADSVTIDGHKQLYLPMGVGVLLLRNPELARAVERQAHYIVRPGSLDLGKRTWNGSRPATVLFLHAALCIIGKHGYEFLVDQGMQRTRYMADRIRSRPEFQLLAGPQINILTYRFIPGRLREKAEAGSLTDADNLLLNQLNERLQKVQRRTGQSFVSRTTSFHTDYGTQVPVVALRVVLANPLTTEADIEGVLQDQVRIGDQLSESPADGAAV